MKITGLRLALVLGCALLASCGGGDGGSSPPPTGGGGPTPTPSPTPTPTPSPTPTYMTFTQLTGTQTFMTTCGGFYNEAGRRPLALGTRFGSGITIVSDRSQPNYNITSDGTGLFAPFSTSFSQADRDTSTTTEAYSRVTPSGFTERFSIFPINENGTALPYLRVSSVVAQNFNGFTVQQCALGVPTLSADVPPATVTYSRVAILGQANLVPFGSNGPVENYRITDSLVTLTANPANGRVEFTLDLRGRLVTNGVTSDTVTPLGIFRGSTAMPSAPPAFEGNVVDEATSSAAGPFGGGFFGPQGGTAALSVGINAQRPGGNDVIVGALIILRPQP